jgi:hypothetical protein
MKEPYAEGLANHGGHESYASGRKVARGALTVVCTGWVLNPEKSIEESADAIGPCGKQHQRHRYSEMSLGSTWSKTPYMYRNSLHGNRESPRSTLPDRSRVRIGNPKGESR